MSKKQILREDFNGELHKIEIKNWREIKQNADEILNNNLKMEVVDNEIHLVPVGTSIELHPLILVATDFSDWDSFEFSAFLM